MLAARTGERPRGVCGGWRVNEQASNSNAPRRFTQGGDAAVSHADDEVYDVRVTVNGAPRSCRVSARVTLAELLREGLGLYGVHLGCEQGICGACTVLVEGQAVRACLMFATQADGQAVRTIEGIGTGELSPVQEALVRHRAMQCGFCTPGIVMTATELYEREGAVDAAAIVDALGGHLCRCTGYEAILRALGDVLSPAEAPAASG